MSDPFTDEDVRKALDACGNPIVLELNNAMRAALKAGTERLRAQWAAAGQPLEVHGRDDVEGLKQRIAQLEERYEPK